MPDQKKVLVVGAVNMLDILSLSDCVEIIITANYEEAIEQLRIREFDHVITDAELPEDESGIDILRAIKSTKKFLQTVVCHNSPDCVANGRKWNIEPGLSHFPGARFFQGTVKDGLLQILAGQQKYV